MTKPSVTEYQAGGHQINREVDRQANRETGAETANKACGPASVLLQAVGQAASNPAAL